MATAMKGVTKALTQMNKKINLPGLQKIMAEFMKENEKADITAEMIGDTLDDAMEEEGSAEEEELIVGQVLDELGIGMSQDTPSAPMGNVAGKAEAKADDTQGNIRLFHILSTQCVHVESLFSLYRFSSIRFGGSASEAQINVLDFARLAVCFQWVRAMATFSFNSSNRSVQ